MKQRILTIILSMAFCCGSAFGQPSWAKKAAKSVFTLKTFAADGSIVGESNGFFVGENGEAVSDFTSFRGASKAVTIDAQGKEAVVDCVLGANEMYDLVKFRVDTKRSVPVSLAADSATVGSTLWLLPYCGKKTPAPIVGKVDKTEKVQAAYSYYTISMKAPQSCTSCPLFNDNGEVVALLQRPATDNDAVAYAVGAKFATDLKLNGLSINDKALRATMIKKDLPDKVDQAILTMYVAPSVLDSSDYVSLVNDFIRKFPEASDGYVYRAQIEVGAGKFAEAEADMEQAIKVAEKKDEAHFSYSKLIYAKEIGMADKSYAPWSLDKAVAEADEAYRINPLPVYREQKAQLLYAQKKYDAACTIYMELAQTNLRSAQTFFNAARCKEQLNDTTALIAMLDSAVSTFNKPYLKEAGPYLLARAQALASAGKYRQAVLDYNEYEKLMPTGLTDNFYYVREQAELNGHLFQQALDDIGKAIELKPSHAGYYAEKAMIELRVNLIDDAGKTAALCINADPQMSDGYLFLGLAQCLKGNKAEGMENLRKAKELGHEQAQAFIEKYAK